MVSTVSMAGRKECEQFPGYLVLWAGSLATGNGKVIKVGR